MRHYRSKKCECFFMLSFHWVFPQSFTADVKVFGVYTTEQIKHIHTQHQSQVSHLEPLMWTPWVIVLLVLSSCSYALLFYVRVQCGWKTSAILEAGPSSSEHREDHSDPERRSSLLKNMLMHTHCYCTLLIVLLKRTVSVWQSRSQTVQRDETKL